MPTNQQQLKTKIAELEQWLHDNSSEHEARTTVESDLRNLKKQLIQYDDD